MHLVQTLLRSLRLLVRLITVGLILILVTACEPNDAESADKEGARIPIRSAVVVLGGGDDSLRIAGVTQATREASLSFQAGGQAVTKYVRIGAVVESGQILAKIDNPEASPAAQAAQQQWLVAQANLVQAQANAERFAELLTQSAVSPQEYESIRQVVDSARAQERAAKANAQGLAQALAELQLRAPFDGVITADHFTVGDFVQPGQTVMRLADPTNVEVEVAVSPLIIGQINRTESVKVRSSLLALGQEMSGSIKHLSPFVAAGSVPQVVVALPTLAMAPGGAVELEFSLLATEQLRVPLRALFRIADGAAAVYKVSDGAAQLTPVELIAISGDTVIVAEQAVSLKAGDFVATDGVAKLFNGALVEVL